MTAIDEYNKMTVEEREANGAAKLAEIATLKATRDAAYLAMNTQWTWVTDKANAFVFVSGPNGQFEVTGLAPGTYNLVEIKAPAGYVLNETPRPFTVGAGSYTTGDIAYVPEGTTTDAQQVTNMKVTIPQTGGIGTVIFGVVGATLMGGAIIAFKKKDEDEQE